MHVTNPHSDPNKSSHNTPRTSLYHPSSIHPLTTRHQPPFQVNLDGRVLTVVLPYEVRPADRVLLQAPSPPVVLKRATAAPVALRTKREGYVACMRCSFDNSVALLACQMCGETISLTHEALRDQVHDQPTTTK